MTLSKEDIQEIFRMVKPIFKSKLGKYTHQRISGDWHFHGLAFVRDEMTYVFGFNIGFFNPDENRKFTQAGMNVLVRINGLGKNIRKQYADFFKLNLKNWFFNEDTYSSFRGGEGNEFSRYKNISEFKSKAEIADFMTDAINSLHKIYPSIIKNPNNIFDNVLRAAYPWHDSITDVAEDILSNSNESKFKKIN